MLHDMAYERDTPRRTPGRFAFAARGAWGLVNQLAFKVVARDCILKLIHIVGAKKRDDKPLG